jgi:tRNA-dihydrouridine synthase B
VTEQMTAADRIAPLRIGPISLGLPVVQAALSGYSDWPMRTIARQLGAPYTIHEVMISDFVNSLRDRARTRRFLMVTEADHPVGAQLMGSDPHEFAAAAQKLVAAGFDVIDVNFGCPMKKVRDQCRGGMHLGQPDVAIEILSRVREATPQHIPVTVKMRRGIDDTTESRDNFFRILEGAVEQGIAAATVHGRTVQQKYVGPSRWEFLREVRQSFPNLTLLGSGDLFTARDCVDMLQSTGVNGVTAARGSIGNPWIFAQAEALLRGLPEPPPPTIHQQRNVLQRHFELATSVYKDEGATRQMRKFGMRYAQVHPQMQAVRNAFIRTRDSADWHAVLDRFYGNDGPGVPPQHPEDPRTATPAELPVQA